MKLWCVADIDQRGLCDACEHSGTLTDTKHKHERMNWFYSPPGTRNQQGACFTVVPGVFMCIMIVCVCVFYTPADVSSVHPPPARMFGTTDCLSWETARERVCVCAQERRSLERARLSL